MPAHRVYFTNNLIYLTPFTSPFTNKASPFLFLVKITIRFYWLFWFFCLDFCFCLVFLSRLLYLNTPWITKGLRKSSKRKQRLYEKFLKNANNTKRKNIKKHTKICPRKLKNMLRKTIIKVKSNTWKMMKEIICKKKCKNVYLNI